MRRSCTAIQVCRRAKRFVGPDGARSTVSLHSHSESSRETLTFVPELAARIPIVAQRTERAMAEYEKRYGSPLDLQAYYWRPPLTAAAVVASERRHIEERLDSAALVSLTDHDTLEGARKLRAAGHDCPLSVEWSAPFGETVFHLGVHAISPSRLEETEQVMAVYTAGQGGDVGEILDWLAEYPETFVVLNHPYWDMARLGQWRHDSELLTFLRIHRDRIHALELNGYRSWSENRRVLPLAEGFGLPVVGGGDRHGRSPNTIVNLTAATTLAEFASELRAGVPSYCVVFPEYSDPFAARLVRGASECLQSEPDANGCPRSWTERVFAEVNGTEVPLSQMWSGEPSWLAASIALTHVLGSRALQPLFSLASRRARTEFEADVRSEDVFAARRRLQTAFRSTAGVRDSFSGAMP